jgi:hypothetical protein
MPQPAQRAFVKIFGERNTGTNALRLLMQRNSEARLHPSVRAEVNWSFQAWVRRLRRLPGGGRLADAYMDWRHAAAPPTDLWKHSAPRPSDARGLAQSLVVVTTRHPASWLVALHRRPYHARSPVPPAFGAFLAMRWRPMLRDRIGLARLTPIELWNVKARAHLALLDALDATGNPGERVRFEDFVADQLACFRRLAPHLAGACDEPRIVEESTKDTDWNRERYSTYYADRQWMADLSPADIDTINRGIDWQAARRLGYAPLPAG